MIDGDGDDGCVVSAHDTLVTPNPQAVWVIEHSQLSEERGCLQVDGNWIDDGERDDCCVVDDDDDVCVLDSL